MSDINSRDSFEYIDDEYTLESILAEFKGSAYIAGEKKTHPDLLDERIKRIVNEAKDGSIAENELFSYVSDSEDDDFFADIRDVEENSEDAAQQETEEPEIEEELVLSKEDKKLAAITAEIDWEPIKAATSFDEARKEITAFFAKRDEAVKKQEEKLLAQRTEEKKRREETKHIAEETGVYAENDYTGDCEGDTQVLDWESLFGEGNGTAAQQGRESDVNDDAPAVFADDEDQTEILNFEDYHIKSDSQDEIYAEDGDYDSDIYGEEPEKIPLFKRIFGSKNNNLMAEDTEEDNTEVAELEEYIEEPDFVRTTKEFIRKRNVLRLKSRLALFVALLMGLFTILHEHGKKLIFVENSVWGATILLVIMQLVVMALSLEILRRGYRDLVKRKAGAETLVLFSNLATYAACCYTIITKGENSTAPFCAVSALSTAFAMWSEYRQFAAMSISLKTACTAEEPKVISCEYFSELDRTMVNKHGGGVLGFYNNLVETDIADQTFRFFAPFLIIAAVLLTVVTSLGGSIHFLNSFAAMMAACATFSALSAFSVPFSFVAKKLKKEGAAIAGWGGADDIFYADGVTITDRDLFPDGADVSSVKAFEGFTQDKVIRYTASLVMASDSGLSSVFAGVLEKQGLAMYTVENFDCLEGGISATVRGERVVCGTAACMALLGVEIPQHVNSKNSMFTVINDELAGVFVVTYKPLKTVQTAILSLLGTRLRLFFGVRDFNVTPMMVQQKLQIPVDDIEHFTAKETYHITAAEHGEVPHTAAVLTRDNTGIFAETVVSAKKLRIVTMINTVITVLAAIIGMFIMFFMCFKGNAQSVSPANLFEFMLAMEIVVIVISRITAM